MYSTAVRAERTHVVFSSAMVRAVTLAVVLCLACATPAAAALPKVPRDWLGVAADGPLLDAAGTHAAEWPRIARSGAAGVRVAFVWTHGQPGGPGAVDFAAYDAPVLAAAREGLGVLPVVYATPEWARLVPGNVASPPRDPEDYARFLTALVARYGPAGSFWDEHPEVRRRPIREWQIWNEPNLVGFWSEQPFAAAYVKLLRAARSALASADPGARAILAGLPNGWDALEQIYRAGGRPFFDAVAIHPYTERAFRVPRFIAAARRVMRRFGDRRKSVWVSELSWPAAKGRMKDPIGIATSERGQARRLAIGLVRLAQARRRLRIERVYWYTWLSAESTSSVFDWSGLRRVRDGIVVNTLALKAFRRVARALRR
jgi:hypothetical protein